MNRLRVAFVLSRFPAASETFVSNQLAGLIDRGHTVDVYADEAGPADAAPAAILADGLIDRVRRPVSVRDIPRAAWAALRGGRPYRLEPRRWMRALRYGREMTLTAFRYGAAAEFRTAGYDIVHAHFGPNGLKAAAMRDGGVFTGRLVVTFHGYDLSLYLRDAGVNAYDRLFDQVDLCLPVTEHWRNRLIEIGCDPSRIRVHRMGVDPEQLGCAQSDGSPAGTANLVTVARLVEKKGIEYAIRAVARVAATTRVDYTIVGDGPERSRLEASIRELGLTDRVRILGWQSPAEVRSLLCRADAAVLPSVTARDGDEEGLPVALMEAMASRLPVVSTRHSGIPELVRDGVEGFLVPERDVGALADRFVRLADRPQERIAMGIRGRLRIEQLHDNRVLNDRLVELYRETLGNERGGA